MGQRDAGHGEGLLNQRGGVVAENHDDDHVDDGGDEAHHDVVGDDGHEGAGEGEVPVVPDVNVDGLRGVGKKHHDVDDEAERDDEHTDVGAHGDGGGSGPADVNRGQGQAEAGDHVGGSRGERGAQQAVDDEVQADEANTDGKTGAKALAKTGAEGATKNGQENRHHNRDAEALNEGEDTKKCVHAAQLPFFPCLCDGSLNSFRHFLLNGAAAAAPQFRLTGCYSASIRSRMALLGTSTPRPVRYGMPLT